MRTARGPSCAEVEAGHCEEEVLTQVDHDIGRTFALCGDGDAQGSQSGARTMLLRLNCLSVPLSSIHCVSMQ